MGFKIALDAGHGLNTAGKQTPDGIKEWDLNDKVRDNVVAILADYDVEIIHTDNNEGNTDEALSKRRNAYVNAGADVFASFHHNAFTGDWNKATGVEVYVDMNATEEDLRLADIIYNKLVAYTGLKGRGIKKANFTVINQNKIPAVLIEGGFMDSTNDYKVITSEEGQSTYARAVAEGLIEFLGLKKQQDSAPIASNNGFSQEVQDWQNAAIADGFQFPKYGADGKWGSECESVAKVAVVKERFDSENKPIYKYPNLTRIVQRKCGFTGKDVDGKCGPDTGDGIERYQGQHGLREDRCVGLNTWKDMLGV